MAKLLILTATPASPVLPALDLLSHDVFQISAQPASLVDAPSCDVILIDATRELASARSLCKLLVATASSLPVIVVVTEGGFSVVSGEWGFNDVVLASAHPSELDARIRLALSRNSTSARGTRIRASGLEIDEANYSVRMHGQPIDLTYKEFELLRFLAMHPARVFTREQLLNEVWGCDYYGGTRTVDVHVRRLRAKLGDLESLIGTVRNVGYRFTVSESISVARAEQTETTEAPVPGTPANGENADDRLTQPVR